MRQRTRLHLSKTVDVGQYVSPGNVLATIYAVDYAEVRLPLSERQMSFMDLEETYRGEDPNRANGPKVYLTWEVGRERHEWAGRIVRAEGAIDAQSRQLFVVAQVEDPYARRKEGLLPLKVGSFVQARIQGRLLRDRVVIPRDIYRRNEYVLVVTPENTLERRPLEVEWSDEDNLVVAEGLQPGERLCMTMLNFPVNGMAVIPTPAEGALLARENGTGPGSIDWEKVPGELRARFERAREQGDWQAMARLREELEAFVRDDPGQTESPASENSGPA